MAGPKARVDGITRDLMEGLFEFSKESHPNEFGAALRVNKKNVIDEFVLPPGALQGRRSVVFQLHRLPPDRDIVGIAHSHPGSVPYPSDEDLRLFSKFGHTHVIIAEPYTWETWRCFDHEGTEVELEIVEG